MGTREMFNEGGPFLRMRTRTRAQCSAHRSSDRVLRSAGLQLLSVGHSISATIVSIEVSCSL